MKYDNINKAEFGKQSNGCFGNVLINVNVILKKR